MCPPSSVRLLKLQGWGYLVSCCSTSNAHLKITFFFLFSLFFYYVLFFLKENYFFSVAFLKAF